MWQPLKHITGNISLVSIKAVHITVLVICESFICIVIYFNYHDSHFCFQGKFRGRFALETAFRGLILYWTRLCIDHQSFRV